MLNTVDGNTKMTNNLNEKQLMVCFNVRKFLWWVRFFKISVEEMACTTTSYADKMNYLPLF